MEGIDKEETRKEAKKILDNFSEQLSKVRIKEKKAKGREGGFREENQGKEEGGEKGREDFRKIMFENAPNKDDDFIIAEKKSW